MIVHLGLGALTQRDMELMMERPEMRGRLGHTVSMLTKMYRKLVKTRIFVPYVAELVLFSSNLTPFIRIGLCISLLVFCVP